MTYLETHWQTVVILAAAVLTVVMVLCGVGWWLWWRLPRRYVDRLRLTIRDPKARADLEDNIRKTVGQLLAIGGTLLGAAVVLIGAASAYLQFTQQQRTAQEQFLKQQQASHDLLISNQVSKGFEQLGSDKLVVRLGGIYALEGVMDTSEQYYQPVLEALCAFVRDGTQAMTGDGPPATDIHATLTVIGRRKPIARQMYETYDLTGVHIPKANLFNADLTRANMQRADLRKAFLLGAELRGANLVGADLREANMLHTDLRGAYLRGAHLNDADLRGSTDLSGASLKDADLSGADLRGTTIEQAHLDEACGTNVKLDPGLTIKPC